MTHPSTAITDHQNPKVMCMNKDIVLEYSVSLPQPMIVNADLGRIRLVIVNLTGNAVKFTERGLIKIDFTKLDEDPASITIKFNVSDPGIGISDSDKAKLFNLLEQDDTSSTKRNRGAGLGLIVSKKLVEAMGGQIGYESILDGGSTFWFTLRLEKSAMIGATGECTRLHGHVLIVDDNKINLQIARKFVMVLGLTVDVKHDGNEAVQAYRASKAQNKPYDFIFMDIQMPILNGLDATRVLRAAGCTCPIVGLSASSDVHESTECGMDDYLSKPINSKDVAGMIRKWFGRSSTRISSDDF